MMRRQPAEAGVTLRTMLAFVDEASPRQSRGVADMQEEEGASPKTDCRSIWDHVWRTTVEP
jgi:hypothetical protein